VDAIAEEAGFSKGVVYSQFGSKSDMFMELLEQRITERGAQNERIVAGKSLVEAGRELLLAANRDAVSEQGWAQLLVEFRAHAAHDAALNRRYADAHRRTVEQLAALVARLHERAGMSPAVPPQSMAEFVLAMGTGIALERAANPAALPAGDAVVMMVRAIDGVNRSGEQTADRLIEPAPAGPASRPDPRGDR
jgi:AcrR family transcriptional regulator